MIDIERFEQHIAKKMAASQIPGFAVAIVDSGEVAYEAGFGVTNLEAPTPVTPTTLFRIGSTTKPLTATTVLRLVDRGLVDLDAPVGRYVEDVRFSRSDMSDRITVRMLLSHRAGLSGDSGDEYGSRDPAGLGDAILPRLAELAFDAPPDTLFRYSNLGIDLAGLVAERVTGKHFGQVIQDEVLLPLGMHRSTMDPLVALTYPMAQAHEHGPDGVLVSHRFAENITHHPAGFLMSNVAELIRFATFLIQRGQLDGSQILPAELVDEMMRPHSDLRAVHGMGYGMALMTGTARGVRRVAHGGSVGTYACRLHVAPDVGIGLVVMTNFNAPDLGLDGIVSELLDELLAEHLVDSTHVPAPILPDAERFRSLEGLYEGSMTGVLEVSADGDQISMSLNGDTLAFAEVRPGVFRAASSDGATNHSIGFVLSQEGSCQYVIVDGLPSGRTSPDDLFRPDPSDYDRFEGVFSGVDRIEVRREGDRLQAHSRATDSWYDCRQIHPQRFVSTFGLLQFHFTSEGGQESLEIQRAYHLWPVPQHESVEAARP